MPLTEREKVGHLLRRFAIGASEAEIDFYAQGGLRGAIDLLLNPPASEEFEFPLEEMENDKGVVQTVTVGVWWMGWMLMTRRPLVHKMAAFWHNHFATSGDKVVQPLLMAHQNEIFVERGMGNFKDLLLDVSRDPAMLLWLDGQENVKGKPNENFAREIMELFTLGVGNYTERDVQEASRAFTGWSFARPKGGGKVTGKRARAEYQFKPVLHDSGVKTVLGKTGNLTGEDVIELLCDNPRTAEFLTEKVWRWFVSDNPSKETLKPLAKAFYDSNLDIKVLLKAIMTSDEFYSPRVVRQLVKNPMDFTLSTLRAMGIGEGIRVKIQAEPDSDKRKANLAAAAAAYQVMKNMGMWVLYPPDVSGWKPGTNWITSATMLERINWANRLMGVTTRGGGGNIKYPVYNLLAADPSPFGIAKKLCSIYDAPLTGAKLVKVSEAAEKAMAGQGLTQANANKVAASAMKLIFGSPEFQFA